MRRAEYLRGYAENGAAVHGVRVREDDPNQTQHGHGPAPALCGKRVATHHVPWTAAVPRACRACIRVADRAGRREAPRCEVHQCKSCPWRVGCDPDEDIPRYSRDLHEELACTIRSGPESLTGGLRIMVCHYSRPDDEFPCAGWLAHQLGPGNNLGVRLAVLRGHLPVPQADGPQHESFEDTLP